MAVPPSDKIPAAKMYRLQYIKQSNSSTMPTHLYDWAVSSNKKYLNYIYFQGQNNGSWYTPVEISATEDTLEFYVGRAGTAAASDFYIYVNGTQYTVGKWGYQVKCIFAAYSSIGSTANNLVASTILPLYDPAYTDTEVTPIVINKLTRSQYGSITPDDTQLYLVTDANLETTNHKVQSIDENSTDTQYPSATAVNNVKYQNEPFWIQPTEDAYVGMVGMTMGPSATRDISYSFDGIEWIDTTVKGLIQNYCYVLQGEKIYFKSSSTGRYWSTQFVVKDSNSSSGDNVDFTVGGRLISLFNGIPGDATDLLSDTNVTDASKLDINSETTCCTCASLFLNCVVLNTPPVLPATLLPDSAYNAMFYGCTSLINAPALPAETLTDFCYMSMFANCTSLRYAPPIKAKTLAEACCQEMFLGCTSLETVPELLATTMVLDCYYSMFSGCTSLKQIPKLYATTLAEECYQEMFNGCTSLELQTASNGTHYNIVKVPEKPEFDWALAWNNNMITQPDNEAAMAETLTLSGLGTPVRYIRDSTNGSNKNASNHWVEIQAFDKNGNNVCYKKTVVGSNGTTYTNSYATDGAINNNYIDLGSGTQYVTIDLGSVMVLHTIKIWHYYADSRIYNDNVTSISVDDVNWTTVYSGTYTETSSGHTIDLSSWASVTDWSVIGATLEGLTFSSNGNNYDSMYCDASGNFYYGASGINTKVYDISTGWVSDDYKDLIVPSDKSLFENLFVDDENGDWLTFKQQNLTIIYGWSVKEQSLSLPFKSNSTDYLTFNVDEYGNLFYDTTKVYDASTNWVNNNYKTIHTTFHPAQKFTGADTWLPFYTTNKISVTGPTTITVPTNALTDMFTDTGGTWTGTPTLNKAYFTNAVLIPDANKAQTDAGYTEIWWKDALISSGIDAWYKLPSSTVFNGSSTYIDTGIQLCDSDKSFTFFVDFQYANKSQYMPVMHNLKEQSPYPGVQITLSSDQTKIRMQYYGETAIANYDTNRHKAIITHEAGTQQDGMFYFDNIVQAAPKTIAYSNFSQNMLLGCYQNTSGTRGRYFNGTIYDCIVLDRVATSSEVSSLLAGTIPSTFYWSVKNQTLSVRFMCNGILYNKLRIDSDGSMYYGQDNVYTIVYNVNTNTWTEAAKRIQMLDSIPSTFINEWSAFLSQSKI